MSSGLYRYGLEFITERPASLSKTLKIGVFTSIARVVVLSIKRRTTYPARLDGKYPELLSATTSAYFSFVLIGSLSLNLGSLTAFMTVTHLLSRGLHLLSLYLGARSPARVVRVM